MKVSRKFLRHNENRSKIATRRKMFGSRLRAVHGTALPCVTGWAVLFDANTDKRREIMKVVDIRGDAPRTLVLARARRSHLEREHSVTIAAEGRKLGYIAFG